MRKVIVYAGVFLLAFSLTFGTGYVEAAVKNSAATNSAYQVSESHVPSTALMLPGDMTMWTHTFTWQQSSDLYNLMKRFENTSSVVAGGACWTGSNTEVE